MQEENVFGMVFMLLILITAYFLISQNPCFEDSMWEVEEHVSLQW